MGLDSTVFSQMEVSGCPLKLLAELWGYHADEATRSLGQITSTQFGDTMFRHEVM